MTDHRILSIALRIIGAYLFTTGIVWFFSVVCSAGMPGTARALASEVVFVLPVIVQLLLGFYLLRGAPLLLAASRVRAADS